MTNLPMKVSEFYDFLKELSDEEYAAYSGHELSKMHDIEKIYQAGYDGYFDNKTNPYEGADCNRIIWENGYKKAEQESYGK